MKTHNQIKRLAAAIAVGATVLTLVACASTVLHKNPAATAARADLTALQSDPKLANFAVAAIGDAERAVKVAEQPQSDWLVSKHLSHLAANEVKTARALASAQYAEEQLKAVDARRSQILLSSRTQEAEQAQRQTNIAKAQVSSLERELAELNAQKSERGMVFTRSDIVFATGKADLKPGAMANFDRLADVLRNNPEQRIVIEGHTDDVGSDESNLLLSQRRAESVKRYLVNQGVNSRMISASGKGEDYPVTSNSTAEGRQKNRRVEVIMENAE